MCKRDEDAILNNLVPPISDRKTEIFFVQVEEEQDVDMKDAGAPTKILAKLTGRPPVPEHQTLPPKPPLRPPQTPQMEVSEEELKERRKHSENTEDERLDQLKDQLQQLGTRYEESELEKSKLAGENERLRKEKEKTSRESEKLAEKYNTFCLRASETLREQEEQTAAAEKDRNAWRLEARKIADELAQCKDDLFSLQPRNGVTDTQVASDWDTLCQQIVRWIDDEVEMTPNLLVRLEELQAHGQLSSLVQKYWGKDRQLTVNRWKMNDDLDCILRYNIHCLLETWIFRGSICLFGLRSEHAEFLNKLETNMAVSKPLQDQGSIDHWRSETLNAVLRLQGFKDLQGRSAKEITREAENAFGPLLARCGKTAFNKFHTQITLPAIELACALRCSTAGSYIFNYGLGQEQSLSNRRSLEPVKKPRTIGKRELDHADVMDIETRMTLKPIQTLAATRDGSIGEEIMLLYPALARRKGDGGDMILRKPLELVKLVAPLPPRNKKSDAK